MGFIQPHHGIIRGNMRHADSTINRQVNLPQDFINHALSRNLEDPYELISFWREALDYRKRFPHLQENIATFVVSTGASSPLTSDNDIFEATHAQFGALEVPQGSKVDESWLRVAQLIDEANTEIDSRK